MLILNLCFDNLISNISFICGEIINDKTVPRTLNSDSASILILFIIHLVVQRLHQNSSGGSSREHTRRNRVGMHALARFTSTMQWNEYLIWNSYIKFAVGIMNMSQTQQRLLDRMKYHNGPRNFIVDVSSRADMSY